MTLHKRYHSPLDVVHERTVLCISIQLRLAAHTGCVLPTLTPLRVLPHPSYFPERARVQQDRRNC